jgi:hypothetical protein
MGILLNTGAIEAGSKQQLLQGCEKLQLGYSLGIGTTFNYRVPPLGITLVTIFTRSWPALE